MKRAATLSSKNQITVPADVRRYLRLKAGETVVFDIEPNGSGAVIRVRRSPTLEELAGSVEVPSDVRGLPWSEIRARAWTNCPESD